MNAIATVVPAVAFVGAQQINRAIEAIQVRGKELDEADLTSALDLTTPMRSASDDEGIACVCNRFDEAADAVNLLIDAGFSADLIQGCSDKWVPYA